MVGKTKRRRKGSSVRTRSKSSIEARANTVAPKLLDLQLGLYAIRGDEGEYVIIAAPSEYSALSRYIVSTSRMWTTAADIKRRLPDIKVKPLRLFHTGMSVALDALFDVDDTLAAIKG